MIFMMSKETVKQLRLLSWRRKLSGKPRQTEISQQRLSLPVQQSSPHHSSSLEIIGETIPAFLEATQLKATWYTNVLLLVDPSDSINAACMSSINSFSQSVGAV